MVYCDVRTRTSFYKGSLKKLRQVLVRTHLEGTSSKHLDSATIMAALVSNNNASSPLSSVASRARAWKESRAASKEEKKMKQPQQQQQQATAQATTHGATALTMQRRARDAVLAKYDVNHEKYSRSCSLFVCLFV